MLDQAGVQRFLSRVAKRRMPQVVRQGQRLDQVFVQPQGPAERAGDRGDFDRMGQSSAMIIACFAGKYLRLGAQSPIGGAMHDPIAITLKRTAVGMQRLGVLPPATGRAMHGVGRKQRALALGQILQGPGAG